MSTKIRDVMDKSDVINKMNVIKLLFVIVSALFTHVAVANEKPIFSIENCEGGKSVVFSIAELQALKSDSITTVQPWEKQAKSYTGIYLHHLINIIDGADNDIYVYGKNQYKVIISKEEMNEYQYMLVYAIDGNAIPRRKKGPLMLIRDLSDIAPEDINNLDIATNLVWFVDKIITHCGP